MDATPTTEESFIVERQNDRPAGYPLEFEIIISVRWIPNEREIRAFSIA